MAATVDAIKEAGLKTKTIVGGAPVTDAYAKKIGADGFSDNAPGAVDLIRQLVRRNGGQTTFFESWPVHRFRKWSVA